MAYNGEISGQLSPSISATDLKTVLDGFAGIDSASVTGSAGSFTVSFGGTQSSVNMSQIFGDAANASCGSTIRTISTTYDANDQILSQSDPSATINYTLDNLGRATTISNSISGLTPTVAFTQAFDAAGNRTELKATIGSTLDFKNTYSYDALHRLVETVQQGQSGGNAVTSKRVTQSYNALSQRTSMARYQSTGTSNAVASTSFSFDTANRLTNIVHAQGSTTLSSYAYTYDGLSRIASITSSIDGLSTYTYDVSSQLIGADHSSQTDETYDYDDNGNRDSSGYTTSSNNRTTAAPGFTYTYDDEGNRTSRTDTNTGEVQETTWDYRNRLTKVVNRASTGGAITLQVEYEYDANNRMVKRVLDADGAGSGSPTTQYWAYDQGINALVEFDGSSGSDLSHRYFWSNQVDELFADEQVTSPSTAGNTLWALSDHLGSIRDIADFNESNGVTAIANHRTLTATGTVVAETNAAVDLLYAFTGKQLDDASGLQHNLFRWYDSVLGQWLSEDPMGFAAGDENLRRYVRNEAIGAIDPRGLTDEPFVDSGGRPMPPWLGGPVNSFPLMPEQPSMRSATADEAILSELNAQWDRLARLQAQIYRAPMTDRERRQLMEEANHIHHELDPGGAFQSDLHNLTVAAQDVMVSIGVGLGSRTTSGTSGTGSANRPAGRGRPRPTIRLPDDALVVRGGLNRPEDILRGTGTHPAGVTGVSVESSPGKTVSELAAGPPPIPNGQVGVTTVGEVRAAGGDVIPTTGMRPNHGTMTGLSPEIASELLQPPIPNPAKGKN